MTPGPLDYRPWAIFGKFEEAEQEEGFFEAATRERSVFRRERLGRRLGMDNPVSISTNQTPLSLKRIERLKRSLSPRTPSNQAFSY